MYGAGGRLGAGSYSSNTQLLIDAAGLAGVPGCYGVPWEGQNMWVTMVPLPFTAKLLGGIQAPEAAAGSPRMPPIARLAGSEQWMWPG